MNLRLSRILFFATLLIFSNSLISNLSSRASVPGVPVLQYHYVGPANDRARKELSVSVPDFEKQMKYLADQGFEPVTLDYFPYTLTGAKGPKGGKPILLTFDDGYLDFYLNVFPILKRQGFHAVEFIPTGKIGGSYYMNWEQIKEIEQSGLVSFAAHSVNHVDLSKLSLERLNDELAQSKKVLEEKTGHPVFYLAYPYGVYNSRVVDEAKRLGYVGAFTQRTAKASAISFNMPRLRLGGFTSFKQFAFWLK